MNSHDDDMAEQAAVGRGTHPEGGLRGSTLADEGRTLGGASRAAGGHAAAAAAAAEARVEEARRVAALGILGPLSSVRAAGTLTASHSESEGGRQARDVQLHLGRPRGVAQASGNAGRQGLRLSSRARFSDRSDTGADMPLLQEGGMSAQLLSQSHDIDGPEDCRDHRDRERAGRGGGIGAGAVAAGHRGGVALLVAHEQVSAAAAGGSITGVSVDAGAADETHVLIQEGAEAC